MVNVRRLIKALIIIAILAGIAIGGYFIFRYNGEDYDWFQYTSPAGYTVEFPAYPFTELIKTDDTLTSVWMKDGLNYSVDYFDIDFEPTDKKMLLLSQQLNYGDEPIEFKAHEDYWLYTDTSLKKFATIARIYASDSGQVFFVKVEGPIKFKSNALLSRFFNSFSISEEVEGNSNPIETKDVPKQKTSYVAPPKVDSVNSNQTLLFNPSSQDFTDFEEMTADIVSRSYENIDYISEMLANVIRVAGDIKFTFQNYDLSNDEAVQLDEYDRLFTQNIEDLTLFKADYYDYYLPFFGGVQETLKKLKDGSGLSKLTIAEANKIYTDMTNEYQVKMTEWIEDNNYLNQEQGQQLVIDINETYDFIDSL